MRDELTGATYERELAFYVRYHGLTHEQARDVMTHTTHAQRDEACDAYKRANEHN